MQRIIGFFVTVLAITAITFWFCTYSKEEVPQPISLAVGSLVNGDLKVVSVEQRNGEEFVCYKSLNGTMFITNNGGTTEVQESLVTCESSSHLVSFIRARNWSVSNIK